MIDTFGSEDERIDSPVMPSNRLPLTGGQPGTWDEYLKLIDLRMAKGECCR